MDIILRTSNPKTEGGNLDDVQCSYRVEAIDADTGAILHHDWIQFSSKGIKDAAAEWSQEAALAWLAQNAEQVEAAYEQLDQKSAERAAAKPMLDAIAATPDQVVTRAEIAEVVALRAAQVEAERIAERVVPDEELSAEIVIP